MLQCAIPYDAWHKIICSKTSDLVLSVLILLKGFLRQNKTT